MKKGKERVFKSDGVTLYHQNFPKKKLPVHSHAEAHLFIPLSDSFDLEVQGQVYEIGFGKMIFLGGSVPHSFEANSESGERLILQFDQKLSSKLSRSSKVVSILPIHPLVKELSFNLFTYAEDEFALSLLRLLLEVLAEILSKQEKGSGNVLYKTQERILKSSNQQFKGLVALMEEDLELQLPDLAKKSGTSPRTLTRLVQSEVQLSPKDLYTFFRVQKACALIYQGELSLTAIAFECGYSSLSQFIINFKKWTGLKPSEFKTSH